MTFCSAGSLGIGVEDAAWDHSVFSKNRDRLLEGDIAAKFLAAVLAQPQVKQLLSTRSLLGRRHVDRSLGLDEERQAEGWLVRALARRESGLTKHMSRRRKPVPDFKEGTRNHDRFHPRDRPGHDVEPRASSSTRRCKVAGIGQKEFTQIYPASGWVEHDPEEIWASVVWTCKTALKKAKLDGERRRGDRHHQPARDRRRLGPRDRQADPQRHRLAGPAHRRRSAPKLKKAGHEKMSRAKTGLLLDPYFSGTKIAWMLDNVKGARKRAEQGELAVRHHRQVPDLAADRRQGARHRRDQCLAHDAVYNIATNDWDDELLKLLRRAARAAARGEGLRRRFRHDATRRCSARRSRSSASPATSRRRPSARPASSPA